MKFLLRGAFALLTAITCGAQAETEILTIYIEFPLYFSILGYSICTAPITGSNSEDYAKSTQIQTNLLQLRQKKTQNHKSLN